MTTTETTAPPLTAEEVAAELKDVIAEMWSLGWSNYGGLTWHPPGGTTLEMGLTWTQVTLPVAGITVEQCHGMVSQVRRRINEWKTFNKKPTPVFEIPSVELIAKFLRGNGCVLWGRAWDVVEDPEAAAKWFRLNIEKVMEFVQSTEGNDSK